MSALAWLVSATEKLPDDAVNYLLPFEFASHIARDAGYRSQLLSILNRRRQHLVAPSDVDQRGAGVLAIDSVIAAYFNPDTAFSLRPALVSAWTSRTVRYGSDSSDRDLLSVERVNRLMSAALLEAMQVASRSDIDALVTASREGYAAGLARYHLDGDRSVFYFAAHVPFAISRLGARDLRGVSIDPERHVFNLASTRTDVLDDNDLWPELYLAQWLADGCQPPAARRSLERLLDGQLSDGSWTPTRQPESSRIHTTAMMYLALLADSTCS